MKVFNIDEVLEFGKYSGYSLQRIYKGSNVLTRQDRKRLIECYSGLLQKYKREVINGELKYISLSNIGEISHKLNIFGKDNYIEISSGKEEEVNYEDSTDFLVQRYRSNISYLSWCIIEIENFCINPRQIKILESLDCFKTECLEVNLIERDFNIDISLVTSTYKQTFHRNIIKKNLEKFNKSY